MTDLPVDTSFTGAEFTGGCQCGRVRYRATMEPEGVNYCHCRMCQRAVGNLFAALAGVRRDRLEWTAGAPAIFESSSSAERGFCRDCGTPLFFRYKASENCNLTVGSFDHPERLKPELHYGIESRVPWHAIGDNLPREPTNMADPRLAGMRSFQDRADVN